MNVTHHQPMREDIPLTDLSLRLAKQAQAEDRAKATAQTGIQFDGDRPYLPGKLLRMPIGPRTLPMEQQLDLNESVDALVEEYGLAQVIRTVKMLAEMNGCGL